MTIVGIILALVGGAGALSIFMGINKASGYVGDIRVWIGVAVIGAVLAVLTRRPRD